MRLLFTAFLLLFFAGLDAQEIHPADTIPAIVQAEIDSGKAGFKAGLRELRPISGAPAPFYTYFWEFGDGGFSFEKEPVHHYSRTGEFEVRLYATNNYDDGKPPPTRPKRIKVGTPSSYASNQQAFFKAEGNIALRTNRMPRPSEEMVLIVAYRNKSEWNMPNLSGKLMVFYNEKQFKDDNFILKETRKYHNEQPVSTGGFLASAPPETTMEDWKQRGGQVEIVKTAVPAIPPELKEKQEQFRDNSVWRFENLKAGEERFMFLSLVTTPQMLQDTNAVVRVSALFVPDNPLLAPETANLELQIVASHDPNKMMLHNRRMNYRFTGKNRKLNYKIRFQNTGEGPAKRVAINVKTPPMLDLSSLKVTGTKPECIPCKDAYTGQSCIDTLIFKDSIQFVFKNIYLPGTKQKGVDDADSTMGYVEYRLGFTKKPKKLPFTSSAAIIFDKNEPIYTNRSVGRFKPGLSPGFIAVYGSQINSSQKVSLGNKNFSLGLSLSPYAPHRKYLQWELYLSSFSSHAGPVQRQKGGIVVIDGERRDAAYQDFYTKTKIISIDAVPLQLRYNINKFIGVGAGGMLNVNLLTEKEDIVNSAVFIQNQEIIISDSDINKKTFDNWRTTLFADVQLGLVRVGPAAGFRWLHSLNVKDRRLAMYLAWKF